MAYDGALIFNTKIDNSGVQKDLDKLKREIQHTQESITKSETARLPLLKQAEELKKKLQEARAELSYIKDEQSAAQSAIGGTSLEDHMIAIDRLPELNAAAETQKAKVDALEKEWSQVNTKIDQYNQKISQGQNLLGSQKAKAAEMSKQMSKGSISFSGAMEKAQGSAAKFSKRIKGIISQVFVFTLISKALQAITKYMGKTLKSNKQFTAELAKLKGALLTAFQPIYEIISNGVGAMGFHDPTGNDVTTWVNPPMYLGFEYRTTELWGEKPVYTQMVYLGYLTGTNKAVNVGVDYTKVIDLKVIAYGSGFATVLPMYGGGNIYAYAFMQGTSVAVSIPRDSSTNYAYAVIKYTK